MEGVVAEKQVLASKEPVELSKIYEVHYVVRSFEYPLLIMDM